VESSQLQRTHTYTYLQYKGFWNIHEVRTHIQFANELIALVYARIRVWLTSAGYNHGIGKNPIPRKIWKTKTIAVAPYAADLVPTLRRTAARRKHMDNPAADVMSRGRRPKRSTVYRGSESLMSERE
jgi:hypothetical protein